ncbi:hypothetical protein K1T71_007642 [Dendrolimus kikuchii]|uniref:Uncharacterized protein n=1 Tax=Dendrolimus kikuchii TaxID=765133 RepID=A0ACC1CXT3_9NEOP|nr:hypothetical protein K1T71_007642 [Dendrolimus kikuchii]
MALRTETVKSKIIKIYELDDYEKLIIGIKVAACMLTESHQVVDEASVLKRLNALTLDGPSDGNCCSCCGVGPFESRAQQTAHYKHHWHTHNLKRKLFGKQPLSLGQFNSRQEDSSVSGSESDEEDTSKNPASDLFAAATRHCKAFFTNPKGQVFCIYRCVLHQRKEELSTDGDGTAWVERVQRLALPGFQRWAVLMVSGGHFAGAIFSGGVVVLHKTMHSYVTRRGQGQAQGTRDQHGSAPRSSGASLRRYNQAQFLKHVQDIIASWSEDLIGCSLVLYRAVGSVNQAAIFGKSSPLNRDDLKVRQLPFPTRKPTYKEVQRVHETVASIEVYDTMELFQKALIASTAKTTTKTSSDTTISSTKKTNKASPHKNIDRAKSRERAPRELPTQLISSEDEGPCYIDSETPVGWIKTLSEQSNNRIITNSRKDLLNDCNIGNDASTESDRENKLEKGDNKEQVKKKKKKKEEKPIVSVKKVPEKIPANVKKIWKLISGSELNSLGTIFESWTEGELESACNTQDPTDGNTALHKAAIAEKPEMITQILIAGGNPCIRNNLLQTPYAASPHHETRIAFRMFQAQHPDKYNYAKSQIPGPITPELLEQERERKAEQKRVKRQRDKEKQLEKIKTNKFLQLTDNEKVKAKESRCFLCGSQLPKKPFEYDAYRFCCVRCLQNHRNIRPLHMSA